METRWLLRRGGASELAVGIGVCAGLAPGPLPGFICLLWIRRACATPSPRFRPVSTPPGLGKTWHLQMPSPGDLRQSLHPNSASLKWGG